MTSVSRQILREVFLTADLGISGANFGVAESGTLCIVTNEGNGRRVTTLPKVHIALTGVERLVPTLDEALMLALLPRSATGQELSVYTSLVHGPRRADVPDGPQERHVILADNGRSKVRQSPLVEILYCIRCGACLNACPVFREKSDNEDIPSTSDIDIRIVIDGADLPDSVSSFVYHGLLFEVGYSPISQFRSPEAILGDYTLACHFTKPCIIADVSGELTVLKNVIFRDFAKHNGFISAANMPGIGL